MQLKVLPRDQSIILKSHSPRRSWTLAMSMMTKWKLESEEFDGAFETDLLRGYRIGPLRIAFFYWS